MNLRFGRENFFEGCQSPVTFVLPSSRYGERLFCLPPTPSENLLEFSEIGGISKMAHDLLNKLKII